MKVSANCHTASCSCCCEAALSTWRMFVRSVSSHSSGAGPPGDANGSGVSAISPERSAMRRRSARIARSAKAVRAR